MQGGHLDPAVAESGDTGTASRQGHGGGQLALPGKKPTLVTHSSCSAGKARSAAARPGRGAVSVCRVQTLHGEQHVRVDSRSGWVSRSTVVPQSGQLAEAGATHPHRCGFRASRGP